MWLLLHLAAPYVTCKSRAYPFLTCLLLIPGHRQAEHETSHGSMSKTLWAVDGPEGTLMEVNGRKFASTDDGAPMLVRFLPVVSKRFLTETQCSMLCRSLGRHAHIDYCRSENPLGATVCSGADLEHIRTQMRPDPSRAKDWVNHDLYWRRTGTFTPLVERPVIYS